MLRLFLAIPLSQEIKSLLTQISEAHHSFFEKANWVKQENYHITLFFLGMVKEEELDQIIKLSAEVAKGFTPFTLEFEKLELKPKRNPRIFWARFKESRELSSLCLKLGKRLSENIELEKQPAEQIPHITLARLKRAEVTHLPDLSSVIPAVEVKGITLFRSELLPLGPVYHPIHTFPLA